MNAAALLLLAACGPKTPPSPASADSLVGSWQVVLFQGRQIAEMADIVWAFDGTEMTEFEGPKQMTTTYSVDVSVTPARLQLDHPPARGIFKVKGDSLTIQLNDRDDVWPADFVPDTYLLFSFERAKP